MKGERSEMSNPIAEKDCFLCGASGARTQSADGDNAERFLCMACGDYDIVGSRARTRLENDAALRAHASAQARCVRASEPDKILVISVDPTTDEADFRTRARLPFPY